MKCLRQITATFGLMALLFGAGSACRAATYYVSTTGSDSNPGSKAAPFASLAKAITVVNPGDIVDIDGGSYSLSGSPLSITRSGVGMNPITIQSTPGQSAILNAAGISSGTGDAIDVDADYLTIRNLTVQNAPTANLAILNGNDDTIQNCTFTGGGWEGVTIGGPAATAEMKNDQIIGCNVHDNVLVNVNGSGSNWGSAIDITNCQYCTVQGNVVYHNWGEGIDCYSNDYTGGSQPDQNNWVLNNTVGDNFSVEIYLNSVQYFYIENNFVYADANAPLRFNAPAVGMEVDNEFASPTCANCQILNNIVVGGRLCFGYFNQHTWSGFYPGGLNGFQIYNNVFYNGSDGCISIDNDPNNSFGLANNISWETNDSVMIAYNGGGNNGGLWNNCWDGDGSNNMYTGSLDVLLANVDPGFVSAGSLNPAAWALKSTSPCFASGWNSSWLFVNDFNWSPRPYSGAWTMGAFAASPLTPGNGGKLLPTGYLKTKNNQITDGSGNPVRIASVGWMGSTEVDNAPIGLWSVNYKTTMNAMVEEGFNCIRYDWCDAGLRSNNVCGNIDYTQNPDLVGLTEMQVLDKIVAYAGQIGLKIILDHHNNEGLNSPGQQANGLWFDLGPGTNGTDGAGDPGTVTAADFQADWVAMAQRYAGNSTVIGCDLDNEPHNQYGANTLFNWGGGGPCDIWAMFTNVGNAIQAVDPGALIICEGPADVTDKSSPIWWMMDLTHVSTKPVVLHAAGKVVYSVHEYPEEISGDPNDSGAPYIARMNQDWGFLESQNIAPVWIGEMGTQGNTTTDNGNPPDTDGIAWLATILPYINGLEGSQGGPVFLSANQPISTDWWYWGTFNVSGYMGNGTLSDWNPTAFVPYQVAITDNLLWLNKPKITALSPVAGLVGDTVTITGANFNAVESVTFNGAPASFTVTSPTSIAAIAPQAGSTGVLKVTTPGGTAVSPMAFTYRMPMIISISPRSGPVGTIVTLSGKHFMGATSVKFHGTPASYTIISKLSATATVPTGATTGTITLTTPGGTATSPTVFTVK